MMTDRSHTRDENVSRLILQLSPIATASAAARWAIGVVSKSTASICPANTWTRRACSINANAMLISKWSRPDSMQLPFVAITAGRGTLEARSRDVIDFRYLCDLANFRGRSVSI